MADTRVVLPKIVSGKKLIDIVDKAVSESGHLFYFRTGGNIRCEPGSVKILPDTRSVELFNNRVSAWCVGIMTSALFFKISRNENYSEILVGSWGVNLAKCSERYKANFRAFIQKIYDGVSEAVEPDPQAT